MGPECMRAGCTCITRYTDTTATAHETATVLRRLHTTRIDRDYAQCHFLQKEAAAICSELNIPYVPALVVKVPDLTGPQHAAIRSVIRSLVKNVPVPRWHKQAIRASIRVVRTVPHSLRKVVEKQENALAWAEEPPECCCNSQYRHLWESAGNITILDGHFALLPVTIYQHDNILQSGDPLPQHGQKSRCEAVTGLERLAGSLKTEHPPWRSALPLDLFCESGSDLKRACQLVENLCSLAYVRIVDKHSSAMWAFCRRWAWDEHIRFVKEEGYQPVDKSVPQVSKLLNERVSEHGWKAGTNARIALMYLLGKAKSLRLPGML